MFGTMVNIILTVVSGVPAHFRVTCSRLNDETDINTHVRCNCRPRGCRPKPAHVQLASGLYCYFKITLVGDHGMIR